MNFTKKSFKKLVKSFKNLLNQKRIIKGKPGIIPGFICD